MAQSQEDNQKDDQYWARIRQRAKEIQSDGCTVVSEIHQECCFEHDIAYRTGKTIDGQPLTRAEADRNFRQCIQSRSRLGRFSPLSWIRWAGVRVFGRFTNANFSSS